MSDPEAVIREAIIDGGWGKRTAALAALDVLVAERDEAREESASTLLSWHREAEALITANGVLEAALTEAREALLAQSNAYGCFAGCTGALPGAPADGSGHTPNCKQARAALSAGCVPAGNEHLRCRLCEGYDVPGLTHNTDALNCSAGCVPKETHPGWEPPDGTMPDNSPITT